MRLGVQSREPPQKRSRTADEPTLRDILSTAESEVLRAWKTSSDREATGEIAPEALAQTILDRLTQLGFLFIEDRQFDSLREVLKTFTSLYAQVGPEGAPSRYVTPLGLDIEASRWFDLITRIYALGALCIALSEFDPVPDLVLQQPKAARIGRFWIRDTVTALARLNRFEKKSLIPPIVEYIAERPVLFKRFGDKKERVLEMLCQFDFLQCVISVVKTDDLHACYPNFATYFTDRTEPIVVQLVTGGPARKTIGDVTDEKLYEIINELDKLASSQAFDFAGWDLHDFRDRRVLSFLEKKGKKA
jgi:hypothetical protein